MKKISFFGVIFFILVFFLLIFYWYYPIGKMIEFQVTKPSHSNFTLNSSFENEMQFYENMRYRDSKISYKISDCPLKKLDEMKRSIEFIEDKTILKFYEVESNEEISITCSDEVKSEGKMFIAGEGGVKKVVVSEHFNIILEGQVLLLRESRCPKPIVGTHELLHALGFDHSDNPNNIMYPKVNCNQIFGEDLINKINYLYSFPSLPDLSIENVSASLKARYLDIEITLKNNGLSDSNDSLIVISSNKKIIKEIEIESIPIGSGKMISFSNLFVPRINIEKIEIEIIYNEKELDKENNKIILEILE